VFRLSLAPLLELSARAPVGATSAAIRISLFIAIPIRIRGKVSADGAEVKLDTRFRGAKAGRMNANRTAPGACRTMAEVRQGVDRLDEEIVRLIGERFRYMDAAARIKPEREAVRDEGRKAQVLANVARLATQHGVPAAAAAELYERLVEASIAYELERFDSLRNGGEAPGK
jgi:isochorismate pyruvate lyase